MADKQIQLRLVTPTKLLFDDKVDMVILRTIEGDIGIMHGHQQLATTLGYGVMKIYRGEERTIYSVIGGFAEIGEDMITVLSESAEKPDEIDHERAILARERAERLLNDKSGHVDTRRAELSLRRALVRIEASSFPLIGKKK